MIAVSTTYFEIRFYDIVASGFKLELTVKGFDSCATCMDYWVQEDKLSHAILVLGDLNGSIYALEFNDCPTICVLQVRQAGKQASRQAGKQASRPAHSYSLLRI